MKNKIKNDMLQISKKREEVEFYVEGDKIDKKLTYISRLFSKTSNKIYEHYVITRIWHLLNNDEIEIIGQQYVKLGDKYALTDMYFPQFDIHVEVNEPAHYLEIDKIQSDLRRNESIIKISNHQLIVIDCRNRMEKIHKEIDELVIKIKNLMVDQIEKGIFEPWNPKQNQDPKYWKEKNIIKVSDKIHLNKIEDICALFEADFNKTKRGFLRRGAISHPQNKNIVIWWPSNKSRQSWENEYNNENKIMIEINTNEEKNTSHINNLITANETRLMFYYYTDFLGFTSYRFKGVYKLDIGESEKEKKAIWKKIADTFNLKTLELN